MGLSPKHQFLATAVFFAIMSGVVGAPIPPMKVLLLFPALGVVAQQLIEAWEPFTRFAHTTKRTILSTRSGPQRPEADGKPERLSSSWSQTEQPPPLNNLQPSMIHTAPSRASL
ncbi:unnamed protein product [Clonostachys rhizophaga]|uniref:Uncharacterized protein n=1 Tax=Clonostachys rhizophaga TaxID=160324 RepID=A0A9N9VB49_9HYPO|nr:unnamed protein product [Clonostachys rhizophaga]